MAPDQIIAAVKAGIRNAEHRFTHGGCYQLYAVLKELYPNAIAWEDAGHIVTEIDGVFYDVTGRVKLGRTAVPLSELGSLAAIYPQLDFK